ncbi:glycoside hydrolase family 3 N-terminal domain-containing protein [Balneolales bacterium ANBcel1]|nr:glycoside hydrolase family 3 N-terminal domain-containing protein [Balneolales bacterium ANBcel1]
MRNTLIYILIFFAGLMISGCQTDTAQRTSDIDRKIDSVMAGMTIAEKAGQMTQVNLNLILDGDYYNVDGSIDPERLRHAVNEYHVGSILNNINIPYDVETWHEIITAIQDAAMENPSQIPVIYGIDAIHGTNYTADATLFPHNIGMAASRNPELMYESSVITARETRASGIRWNFDPVLDIGRNPLWPRFEETFGEDPHIVTEMNLRTIDGYQGSDLSKPPAVAATLKHFLGYSNPRTGRDRTPAWIPEIEYREYELPAYQKAIDAGAATVMINSGDVNGVPVHGDPYLLTEVLRNELGFEGVIVSDWEDVNRLHERHNVAPTLKEAVRQAVMAGIDISMTPQDFYFADYVIELYDEDPEVAASVDASVRRILRLKFELGLFDNPYPEPEAAEMFGLEEYAEVALDAARQTMTLLQNNGGVLPLDGTETILLAGPGADNLPALHGSWSFSWQGQVPELYPETTRTVLEALTARIGSDNVTNISDPDYYADANYDTARLRQAAARADHIVLVLGEFSYAESPGSIRDLAIDPRQSALALAAAETGTPVTVVLAQGRPRIIREFADEVDAILMAYRPASEGANAIVDVLYGDWNPGGKLPFTYPRNPHDLVLYDHKWTELNYEDDAGQPEVGGYDPQFPFGHGLSYTTFGYSGFEIDRDTLRGDDSIRASVIVTNTGDRAGHEAVELYSRHMYPSIVPPLRRLRAFRQIHLEPGEEKRVEFEISTDDLAYVRYGEERGTYIRGIEEGEIRFMIGGFGFEFEPPEDPDEAHVSRPYKHSLPFYYIP